MQAEMVTCALPNHIFLTNDNATLYLKQEKFIQVTQFL